MNEEDINIVGGSGNASAKALVHTHLSAAAHGSTTVPTLSITLSMPAFPVQRCSLRGAAFGGLTGGWVA